MSNDLDNLTILYGDTTMPSDQHNNPIIGHIDIGGCLVPRAQLAAQLPDLARFERRLGLATRIDAYMTEHDGAVPHHLLAPLDKAAVAEVIDKLTELGSLQQRAADELEQYGDGPEAA